MSHIRMYSEYDNQCNYSGLWYPGSLGKLEKTLLPQSFFPMVGTVLGTNSIEIELNRVFPEK